MNVPMMYTPSESMHPHIPITIRHVEGRVDRGSNLIPAMIGRESACGAHGEGII